MLVACWKPLDAPTQFTFFFGVFFFKDAIFQQGNFIEFRLTPSMCVETEDYVQSTQLESLSSVQVPEVWPSSAAFFREKRKNNI